MTDNERKESISALRQLLAMCDFVDQYGDSIDADPYFNAVETAIESLNETRWIPVSERLPKAENMYQPPEQRYLCQLEAYGERKFCVLSRLKGAVSPFWDWYGVAVHDSEVTAWMPLPTPYKGGDD